MPEELTHVLQLDVPTKRVVERSFAGSARVSELALSSNLAPALPVMIISIVAIGRGSRPGWR